jgi:hypothetical protein
MAAVGAEHVLEVAAANDQVFAAARIAILATGCNRGGAIEAPSCVVSFENDERPL